jgi:hypothetical protein
MFDWLENVSPLMTNDYVLHDGCSTLTNCSKADSTNPWSYNYGIMIGGAAYVSPLQVPPTPNYTLLTSASSHTYIYNI